MQKELQAGSSDVPAVLLSSDDESAKGVSKNVPVHKRPQRRSVGRPRKGTKPPAKVEKSKKTEGEPEDLKSTSTTDPFTKPYELRPTTRRMEQATKVLSFSDDESSPVAGSRVTKRSSISTRMTLSESKFRKRLTDIQKGSILPHPTSTPFTRSTPVATATVKTRLQFSSDRETRSMVQKKRPAATAAMISKPPPVEEVTIAEDTSEEVADHTPHPPPTEQLPNPEEKEKEVAWPQIGWAEYAFAAFITAVAALGYYYSS